MSAEGATLRLALDSLRNGIFTDIEWQLSRNPGLFYSPVYCNIQIACAQVWRRIFAKRGQPASSADLKQFQIEPLSQGKQDAVLEKWRTDTEGESKISHTVLEFLEES